MAPNFEEYRSESLIDNIKARINKMAFRKQDTTKLFQRGDQVEVASQEWGYIGAYYTATIVSLIGNSHYRVQYTNLVNDDKSDLLEEIVTASEIRPMPPKQHETLLIPEDIRMYDIVDVFDNDGWWIGFISGRHEENYYVYFPTTGDNVAYPPQLLRFHQEWSKGKWISSN
ncbi:protein AGENET DOMAIN (AGD)-CONTAINING P1-like [Solanum dulcamara]|uniref:protein AGENET DOMAIN (AGD)-CONTAINING P1-like n=1 Tax=Solanum dulcamara TaxID=45834 RepID=UPI002485B79F|nr:protein AGENET DOMAIN (AGD)-CONTAINING P1-like [Solanum dulcamara]